MAPTAKYLALSLLLLVGCSSYNNGEPEEVVIAQINDLKVSEAQFKNAFKEFYYRTGRVLGQDKQTKQAVLNSTFGTYVLATYAFDIGLDKSEDASRQRGAIERRVLTEEYLDQVILADIAVSDLDAREFFTRFNSQLRASHLYASTRTEIDQIYQRLKDGEAFEKLAAELFENPYMAQNGGDIGRFSTDELDIAFENAAYGLEVGEISEPIRTMQGYSIIKLTDRIVKPMILENDYVNARDNMLDYAYSKKVELSQRNHMYNFLDNLKIDDEVLEDLWALVSGNYSGMVSKEAEFVGNLESVNKNLASWNDFSFSTDDFITELLVSDVPLLLTIKDARTFRDFIMGTAYRAYMVKEARNLKIDTQPLVQSSIEQTWLSYLADEAVAYLENGITNTPAELYNFYLENQAELYFPQQINLQRLVVRTQQEADALLQKAVDGTNFSELVSNYTINNDDLFTNGILGLESVQNYGFMAPDLVKLDVGELSDVIAYHATEFHIYKMLEKVDGRPMSFDEARDQINRVLTQQKLQLLRDQTIEEVKKLHNATINNEILNALTIQI